MCALLSTLQGRQSFHNFTLASGANRNKFYRNVIRATCSSFLLQETEDGEWINLACLSFTAKSFLYDQPQHMAGCLAMVASGHLPESYLQQALSEPADLRVPRAPPDGVMLVSTCFARKLPRPDSSAVWVGPRELGGAGTQQAYAGEKALLLDWRASLHRAQALRVYKNRDGWGRGLVQQARGALGAGRA